MLKKCFNLSLCFLFVIFLCNVLNAQFAKDAPKTTNQGNGMGENGTTLGEAKVMKWRCGAEIIAARGACSGILVTTPLPTNWPEQTVRILEEDISPNIRVIDRALPGGVKQMAISIPRLPSGATVQAIKLYEIATCPQYAPDDTDSYRFATLQEIPVPLRAYLKPSPLIECNDPKIRALAKTIGADEPTAWKQVEAIYDWVRNEITYKNGSLKGALAALRDKTGDCEELTSLFIAICRAKGIPARTVWVPGHCYPEFYLVDKNGKGVWFPCQAAGTRAFGEMPETYIILQKGDSFPDPVSPSKRVRYIPEGVTGKGGEPRANFIREKVEF
ncbi:MAG: transglutaminase family protein [Thermoguttaceae bacterium]|nr:transglutaminase family protein [Thermoguttaceae bacterium]